MTEPTIADEMNSKGGENHWHKVAGMLCMKLGRDVRLDAADVTALAGHSVVLSHEQGGTVLRVRVLPDAEAQRLGDEFQKSARRKG